mgnify:CR=1 FL=1
MVVILSGVIFLVSSSEGAKKGLTGDAKDMNVDGPQDIDDLKANPAGHGAEKKGKAN